MGELVGVMFEKVIEYGEQAVYFMLKNGATRDQVVSKLSVMFNKETINTLIDKIQLEIQTGVFTKFPLIIIHLVGGMFG